MTASAAGDLRDALRRLSATATGLASLAEPLPDFETRLRCVRGSLEAMLTALGNGSSARPPVARPEYTAEWTAVRAGRAAKLSGGAIRYLCWDSSVAVSSDFHDYLRRERVDLASRPLEGLIRAAHHAWTSRLAATPVRSDIDARLRRYTGPNRLLQRWQATADMITGPDAPARLGWLLAKERRALAEVAKECVLDPQSQLFSLAVRDAVERCLKDRERDRPLGRYIVRDLLAWDAWKSEDFKAAVTATLLSAKGSTPDDFRDLLVNACRTDSRLRDPRLDANRHNWAGVSREATDEFIKWLSREDIVFFFEHVLPTGRADPHNRKEFWLRYVASLRMSRPMLSEIDFRRLSAEVQRRGGAYGRMGWNTSAFLLDFGTVVAVEFSRVGNACYLYKREAFTRLLPDFWTTRTLSESQLKDRGTALDRVSHILGWQDELAGILARHSIRAA